METPLPVLSELYDNVYVDLIECSTFNRILREVFGNEFCQISGQFSYVRRSELHTCLHYIGNRVLALQNLPVLDIGCGTGGFTRRFASIARNAIGVDISPAAISKARQIANDQRINNVDFLVASFEKLPFSDNLFSTVIAFDAIQHARPYSVVARELHRILASGGHFIFTNWIPKGTLLEVMNRDQLYRELQSAGFSITDLQVTDPGLISQVKLYVTVYQHREQIEREGGAALVKMLLADAKHIAPKLALIQRGLTVAAKK